MKIGSLYDRLEVGVDASSDQIRGAYQKVKKALEPDATFRNEVEELQPLLKKMQGKVLDAYKTLTDPNRRREYDLYLKGTSPEATAASNPDQLFGQARESLLTRASTHTMVPAQGTSSTITVGSANLRTPKPRPSARDRVQKGAEPYYVDAKKHLDAGLYFEAIGSLNEAVRLDPENGKYHRLLGKLLAQNPSCTKASQQHFQKAIEINPKDTSAYLGLAELFEEAGLEDRARKVYEKVTTIDPENEVALCKLSGIAGASRATVVSKSKPNRPVNR
jgi:tetratricopeptide (TPR) repeat protein